MITLGINAAFHDSAAALVIDGVVVAAAEEERFSRIKHAKRPLPFSTWELPFHAIDYCLEQAGLTLQQVSDVAYSFDPQYFVGDGSLRSGGSLLGGRSIELPLTPAATAPAGWDSPWDPLFIAHIVNAPGQLADGAPHHLRRRLAKTGSGAAPYRWHFVNHHLSHQASAFLAAPFRNCAVMTLDGRGERATTAYGRYRDDRYESFGEVFVPHSLGMLYERLTTHLGFLHSSDEYKVMALAALGEPRQLDALKSAVRVFEGGRYEVGALDLVGLFGPRRGLDEPLSQRHFDAAASLQKLLEGTVLALAEWLRHATGERQLAMAGGVALNCVMNSVLRDSRIFDAVWIQPAAGDAGTALGAALWTDARGRCGRDSGADAAPPASPMQTAGRSPAQQSSAAGAAQNDALAPRRWQMDDAYLGPEFSDAQIERHLAWAKLDYRRVDDVAAATAELLADDKIVGWFQGRMEYGPRALGARSLLASPRDPAMQARLNELKDREDFRPVAPVVPVERLGDWFEPADANGGQSPFMLFVYDVVGNQSARIPSACHTDKTARVQTVDRRTNPRFHALLEAFGEKTGVPVLVNTSFNVRGQPVVCTPRDAIEAFFSTPLDALVIGSFVVVKPPPRRAAA